LRIRLGLKKLKEECAKIMAFILMAEYCKSVDYVAEMLNIHMKFVHRLHLGLILFILEKSTLLLIGNQDGWSVIKKLIVENTSPKRHRANVIFFSGALGQNCTA